MTKKQVNQTLERIAGYFKKDLEESLDYESGRYAKGQLFAIELIAESLECKDLADELGVLREKFYESFSKSSPEIAAIGGAE